MMHSPSVSKTLNKSAAPWSSIPCEKSTATAISTWSIKRESGLLSAVKTTCLKEWRAVLMRWPCTGVDELAKLRWRQVEEVVEGKPTRSGGVRSPPARRHGRGDLLLKSRRPLQGLAWSRWVVPGFAG